MKTETDQAAPNGFTIHVARKGGGAVAQGSPDRSSGEFLLNVSAVGKGDALELQVRDPMGRPVPFAPSARPVLTVDEKALSAGAHDAGVLRVELPTQEPVEAFAFGGRVFDQAGKPLPAGYVMEVATADGKRKTNEDIVDGKFALIFIDLQGSFPRIAKGDKFVFTVKDKEGATFPVEPSGYALTNTDIANSSIATLEFKVAVATK